MKVSVLTPNDPPRSQSPCWGFCQLRPWPGTSELAGRSPLCSPCGRSSDPVWLWTHFTTISWILKRLCVKLMFPVRLLLHHVTNFAFWGRVNRDKHHSRELTVMLVWKKNTDDSFLPITMCGFLANTKDWDIMSIPPTMTAATEMRRVSGTGVICIITNQFNGHLPHLTPMLEPKASNCSEIWNASSLVGVRTRVWSLCGEASSDWRMGRAKAPVFPEPVSARPITSLPAGQEEGTGGQ